MIELKPAIFLDRDGTIIEDNGYIKDLNSIDIFPFTLEALGLLKEHFLLFIISNQSGIAKGLISESDVALVNSYIYKTLHSKGIKITETFICPHKTEDNCNCKKPKPYFILKAATLYNLDLSRSFIIGDHPSDIKCGLNARVTPVYVLTGHGQKHKDELNVNPLIFENLLCASKYIISTI